VTLPNPPGGDRLGTSIRHRPPGQSVTDLELLLDALELSTFHDMNCRAGRGDFNASKIIEKYEDLIHKMGSGILLPRAATVPLLPSPSPARINWCALTTPHTLGDIIVALNKANSMLQK
jgi:hypothetical protein